MKSISLSARGLSGFEGIPGFETFTFKVGDSMYVLPKFIALFISPKLMKLQTENPNISSFTFQTNDTINAFGKIIDIAYGKTVQIFGKELQTLHGFAIELENAELCNLLQEPANIRGITSYKTEDYHRLTHKVHGPLISKPTGGYPTIKRLPRLDLTPVNTMLPPLKTERVTLPKLAPLNLAKENGESRYRPRPPASGRIAPPPTHHDNRPIKIERLKDAEDWKIDLHDKTKISNVLNTKLSRRGLVKIGKASITASSVKSNEYCASNIINSNIDKCFISKNECGSWIEVDFKQRFVIPEFYSIGGIASVGNYQPKHWALEILHSGEWYSVDYQKDTPLKQGETRVIPLEKKLASSCFRLRQIGRNTDGTLYLALSTFELFGSLYEGRIE